jgi:hypothetical protein
VQFLGHRHLMAHEFPPSVYLFDRL